MSVVRPSEKRKRVIILGSTGSIGTSALKVARDIPERMEVVGLAAARSTDVLAAQAVEFGVKQVALTDAASLPALASALPDDVRIFPGEAGLVELIQAVQADMVLIAIVGTAGLRPALAAIEAGCDLAIASKEILVTRTTRAACLHACLPASVHLHIASWCWPLLLHQPCRRSGGICPR